MNKFKAIVIDDEPGVCEAVKAILETEGLDVKSFIDSVAAAEEIKKNSYDVIISDFKMPGMNGLELHQAVRDASPQSIFIIITAFGSIPFAAEAAKKGIFDFIAKPFTPEEVRIPLGRALQQRRLAREKENLQNPVGQKNPSRISLTTARAGLRSSG